MNEKKIMKGNEGITLVALVVTIVVLLILAGMSLNLVLGENGIITRAQQAKKQYQEAKVNEESGLNSLSSEMNKFFNANKNPVKGTISVLEENDDSITVKIDRDGAKKYQFSLDGTNWSTEQNENEYTFKNLTKTVVNKDNYKNISGTEYKVYSKVIDSDGNEFVYGPVNAKTPVVVEADSKYLEYEELNGEITITGILYNQDYELNSLEEMENMLASPEKILIPSYIDGKPVTKISEELIKETTTTLKEKDENVHAWALIDGRYL